MRINQVKKHRNFRAKAIAFALLLCLSTSQFINQTIVAEKAGEIVGTIAMEVVLGKGAAIGLKALKGTALAAKIEVLAQTTKAAISEVKVPVKVTSQVLADAAGGTQKIFNLEKKSVGELRQNIESQAKETRLPIYSVL